MQQHYNWSCTSQQALYTAAPTSKGSTVRPSSEPTTPAGEYAPGKTISSAGLDMFPKAGRTQPMTFLTQIRFL
jgi:hypothetical protein